MPLNRPNENNNKKLRIANEIQLKNRRTQRRRIRNLYVNSITYHEIQLKRKKETERKREKEMEQSKQSAGRRTLNRAKKRRNEEKNKNRKLH